MEGVAGLRAPAAGLLLTPWRGTVVSTAGEPSSDMWPPADVRRSAARHVLPPDVLIRGSPAAPGPMSDGRRISVKRL